MMIGDAEHFFKDVLVRCLSDFYRFSSVAQSCPTFAFIIYGVPIIYDYINCTLKLL